MELSFYYYRRGKEGRDKREGKAGKRSGRNLPDHYQTAFFVPAILCNALQGGPRKVKPTTILLVTFECVGKIQ